MIELKVKIMHKSTVSEIGTITGTEKCSSESICPYLDIAMAPIHITMTLIPIICLGLSLSLNTWKKTRAVKKADSVMIESMTPAETPALIEVYVT